MKRKLFPVLIFSLLAVCVIAGRSSTAHAASFNYTDFPMDDATMRSTGTMTASEIQSFLVAKGSGLAVFNDVEDCGPTSGAHYAHYATYYRCGQTMSAAQIIWDASQAYGINPQVLLATMQKEQSLITTPNPTASQLNYAMGYGCPDNGTCGFAGFFNQLDNAAWQFRTDMELGAGNTWWGYSPSSYPCNGGTRYYSQALKTGNDVTFYDDAGTGYTHFVIPNMATATLYCYTPHVYPGSAQQYYSGSYWFVYYYTRWFSPYAWRLMTQYTDKDMANLRVGEEVHVGFTALNTGSETWTNTGPNPVKVGSLSPFERKSLFADPAWLGPSRPAQLREATVAPGAVGTFEFVMKVPNAPGVYNERFGLVAEGKAWLNDVGLSYYARVVPDVVTWQLTGQYADKDMANLRAGDTVTIGFTAKNTGNVTWSNTGINPIRVGTLSPVERKSLFADPAWLGPSRPAQLREATVAPGAVGTFEFVMKVPNAPGVYNERFGLVAEGKAWLNDVGLSYYARVVPDVVTWQLTGQYADKDMANLRAGDTVTIGFTAKNTGNVTWSNTGINPIRVGTLSPVERKSLFADPAWLGPSRPAQLREATVAPGAVGTFEFVMKVPNAPGVYNERFGLVAEGKAWLNDVGLSYYARVL